MASKKKDTNILKYVAVTCAGDAYASECIPQLDHEGYIMWLSAEAPNRWVTEPEAAKGVVVELDLWVDNLDDREAIFHYDAFMAKYSPPVAKANPIQRQLEITGK